ncbi:MAG: alpha/beta hydrolase, partial [Acidobacteriota bacterium]|nr:alpha/beta hydrolase [Acidobacteriota bacterium]
EYRSMFTSDPAATLRKVKTPVLAMNGSRDLQVSPEQNLPAIVNALVAGGNSDFTVSELPGLNHLFQKCNLCTVSEYSQIEETFSPAALQLLGEWLIRHIQ